MANFRELSRYSTFESQKNRSGKSFVIKRLALNLEEGENDFYVTVSQDLVGRPDLISFKAYGMPDLWWVILEFNNIKDPLFGIRVGDTLKIPSLDRVLEALG